MLATMMLMWWRCWHPWYDVVSNRLA